MILIHKLLRLLFKLSRLSIILIVARLIKICQKYVTDSTAKKPVIGLFLTLFLAICKQGFTKLILNFFIIFLSYQMLTKKSTGDKELWGGYYGI
jgi:hypothetical protein